MLITAHQENLLRVSYIELTTKTKNKINKRKKKDSSVRCGLWHHDGRKGMGRTVDDGP